MAALQDDEEAQRKGMVIVVYDCGNEELTSDHMSAAMVLLGVKFMKALPWRIRACHFCNSRNTLRRRAISWLQLFVGKEGRLRFRTHQGMSARQNYVYVYLYTPKKWSKTREWVGNVLLSLTPHICLGLFFCFVSSFVSSFLSFLPFSYGLS